MAFYSFPVFSTDLLNPLAAAHQFLWDDDMDATSGVSQGQRRRRIEEKGKQPQSSQGQKSSPSSQSQGQSQNPSRRQKHRQLSSQSSGTASPRRDGATPIAARPPTLPPTLVKSFAPRFDVRETKSGYHLDGELPGVKQSDIDIEFADPHTLLIRGQVRRQYDMTNAGEEEEEEEDGDTEAVDMDSGDEFDDDDDDGQDDECHSLESTSSDNQDGSDDRDRSETPRRPSFQATVEDTDEDGNPIPPARTHDSAKQVRKSRSSSADEDEHGRVAKKSKRAHHGSGKQQHGGTVAPAKQTKAKTPFGVKYWVTERTTGAFHRTFNFPSRVDQDRVTATLRDGLLSIYVPKLREQRGRKKITIVC